MTKLFAALLTVSILASTSAFADTLTIGSAGTAPVFANHSGNAAIVSDIGSATRAPVYALMSGEGTAVVDLGNASRAPVYAQQRAADVALSD